VRTVIGYRDGKPQWSKNEPHARGRVAGYGTGGSHALTALVGVGAVADAEPIAERKTTAKAKETR
jgi:hypothetical protein